MVQKSKYLINQINIIYLFASGPQVTKTLYLLDIFYRFKTLTGQVNYLPWGLMFSDKTDKPQKENVNKLLSDIRGITGGEIRFRAENEQRIKKTNKNHMYCSSAASYVCSV